MAAKLLTNPGGRVHLVYTSGVEPHMERLKKILESDPEACLSVEHLFTSEAVGLNYTCWTKMKVLVRSADRNSEVALQIDGELPGRLPATFQIIPEALRVRIR